MNKPGEHYRLLVCIIKHLRPRVTVEIGSGKEAFSSRIMHRYCKGNQLLYSFDINFDLRHLSNKNLIYSIEDITSSTNRNRILGDADFIFIDTEHTGEQEHSILQAIYPCLKKQALLMFDDIHLNDDMEDFWCNLDKDFALQKQDVSFLGHWSGTGLALVQ